MVGKIRSLFDGITMRSASAASPTGSKKRFARCILHIGSEKTGTTSIQSFLARNRRSLARDGYLYPKATGKSGGSQWGFVACAHEQPWSEDFGKELGIHSRQSQVRYKRQLLQNLQAEFERNEHADVLLISSEHFHSRLSTRDQIDNLKALLEPFVERFEIVLYLRRQDKVALSTYSDRMKYGTPDPIFFPHLPDGKLVYYFDYEKIYDLWSASFGEENIRVRLFAPAEWIKGDLIADFCSVCGINLRNKRGADMQNQSLTLKGAQFLIEANRQLPKTVDGRRNDERDVFIHLVSQLYKGEHYPASRKQAMAFYQQYEAGNERLRQCAFPARPSPLFSEDFSDYPGEIEHKEPSYPEAVEIAISIWRETQKRCLVTLARRTARNLLAKIRRT